MRLQRFEPILPRTAVCDEIRHGRRQMGDVRSHNRPPEYHCPRCKPKVKLKGHTCPHKKQKIPLPRSTIQGPSLVNRRNWRKRKKPDVSENGNSRKAPKNSLGIYRCGMCGEIKKGHKCLAPEINPSSPSAPIGDPPYQYPSTTVSDNPAADQDQNLNDIVCHTVGPSSPESFSPAKVADVLKAEPNSRQYEVREKSARLGSQKLELIIVV